MGSLETLCKLWADLVTPPGWTPCRNLLFSWKQVSGAMEMACSLYSPKATCLFCSPVLLHHAVLQNWEDDAQQASGCHLAQEFLGSEVQMSLAAAQDLCGVCWSASLCRNASSCWDRCPISRLWAAASLVVARKRALGLSPPPLLVSSLLCLLSSSVLCTLPTSVLPQKRFPHWKVFPSSMCVLWRIPSIT